MSIIQRALTSESDAEIVRSLQVLKVRKIPLRFYQHNFIH